MKHLFTALLIALLFLVGTVNAQDVPEWRHHTQKVLSLTGNVSYDTLKVSHNLFERELNLTYTNGTVSFTPRLPRELRAGKSYVFSVLGGHGKDTLIASAKGFVPDTLILNFGPLPIQLKSFSVATVQNTNVTLTWATASETNNYGFYVQRDGVSVSPLIAGMGTSAVGKPYSYTDNAPTGQHRYGLLQVDLDGTRTLSETILVNVTAPNTFSLSQNYPNPFNPSTQIQFSLDKTEHVTLTVYNVLGERVAVLVNDTLPVGNHTATWNPSGLASGAYVYSLQTDSRTIVKRMIFMK